MYKILIIEDDLTIAQIMRSELAQWGYEVECAGQFTDILPDFVRFAPQLVLLDVTLPGRSGFYWCAELRRVSKLPIMFVSSAGDNLSLITAMNMGADDFIVKPFDLHVLVAKVQALLRRAYEFEQPSELLQHRGVILHVAEGTVYFGEERIELTRNEYRILHVLMQRRSRTVAREELMRRLWESDSYIDDNTLTVNVTRLRKKLEEAGIHDFIQTKKGEGYRVD